MRINVWMRRGGYLFLARTQAAARRAGAQRRRCRTAAALPTRMIAPEEARALVPELDGSGGASSPPATTRPTASCSRGRSCGATRARPAGTGVTIHTSTPVTAIERGAGGGFV